MQGTTGIAFRRAERSDLEDVQRWLSAPHVSEWWGPAPDAFRVEAEYGPCIDGIDPTLVFVVTLDGRSVGMVQTYLLTDNLDYEQAVGVADAAGIDLLIGEQELVGSGLGTEIISTFLSEIGWSTFPAVKRYMAGPSEHNVRSRRAFARAGFCLLGLVTVPGEPDQEAVMVIERPWGDRPPRAQN